MICLQHFYNIFTTNLKWQVVIGYYCKNVVDISFPISRDATSTTFLQQFYNKSQVVSCYWFKFETNIKITFLP